MNMKTLCSLIAVWLTISSGFSQSPKEFLDHGREKIKQKNYGDAIADFSKAIEMEPQNADALFLRGSLKIIIDDSSGAISDLDKALEIITTSNPNNLNKDNDKNKIITNNSCIYCHLGYLKAKLDDPAAAIAWFDKAIQTDSKRGETWYRRGIAEILYGKKENGCFDLNKAKELGYKQASAALKSYCP